MWHLNGFELYFLKHICKSLVWSYNSDPTIVIHQSSLLLHFSSSFWDDCKPTSSHLSCAGYSVLVWKDALILSLSCCFFFSSFEIEVSESRSSCWVPLHLRATKLNDTSGQSTQHVHEISYDPHSFFSPCFSAIAFSPIGSNTFSDHLTEHLTPTHTSIRHEPPCWAFTHTLSSSTRNSSLVTGLCSSHSELKMKL